ncbi:HGGxSTG domain-containing protein [Mesorhizobium sp. BAC0120]|uniref:HGGxSTG domain-containing protein n=1 Tax=Mesorhizobium sp. BAC0120 TaxID=3090670 RepID=UPI00399A6D91
MRITVESVLSPIHVPAASKAQKICGAKTRTGTPCKNRTVPGKKRCRLHGGLSTWPKTLEGRERISTLAPMALHARGIRLRRYIFSR